MKQHIAFVAAEGLPFVKTGGLADVIGSLPQALHAEGFKVSVILPLYLKTAQGDRSQLKKVKTLAVDVGQIKTVATIFKQTIDAVDYYLIEHQGYFEREGYYGYPDDGERFSFFQHAVLRMIEDKVLKPTVVHAHDWHTGLIPLLLKTLYAQRIDRLLSIFTIHNLYFQGNFPKDILPSCVGLPERYYHDGTLRFKEGISFMKAGIAFADVVSTVSKTYAQEILTPWQGENMEYVLQLRQYDLYGIVNGIDVKAWNPAQDEHLAQTYTLQTHKKGKAANKKALQRELGLKEDSKTMMIALITRLTDQKGLDLLVQSLPDIMGWDVQLVILGSGDAHYESQLKSIEFRYPRRAAFYCGYNESLAHRIYAGADVFLMPSLFEPCGISQLIAMRYGTLPVVRSTGGLKDTVEPYNQFTQAGTGFAFEPFNANDMKHVLWLALETFTHRPKEFTQLIRNAMRKDVSWERSAREYSELIHKVLN